MHGSRAPPYPQVQVSRVKVIGLKRTKNDIVVEQVKGVLKASTLNEVYVIGSHACFNAYLLPGAKLVVVNTTDVALMVYKFLAHDLAGLSM